MRFELNFDNKIKTRKSANSNFHHETAWEVAYAYLEEFSGILQSIPQQFAVHHMYELLNRPWRPDKENVADVVKWLLHIQDLNLKAVNQ